MTATTLVELCCGSAALTLHLLGASRPLLPYQGSKWRFRRELAALAAELGHEATPTRVRLFDPGPWGATIGVVLDPVARAALIAALEALGTRDPRTVFDALQGGVVPESPVERAAEYLFLQRLSFSGKAVGMRDGHWVSPGFNVSSAYGLAATDRFGAVLPMIPSLVRVLRGYDDQLRAVAIEAAALPAPTPPEAGVTEPTLVYLDPPYARSTAYPNGELHREEVVALALAWAEAGAAVIVSEGEVLPTLVLHGWKVRKLDQGRDDTSPFRGKQAEWVTYAPAAPKVSG